MQYILTDIEYKTLVQLQKSKTKEELVVLQDLCTKVADHMPIKSWISTEPTPWGCVLTAELREEEWYCDECPVQKVCPNKHKPYSQ